MLAIEVLASNSTEYTRASDRQTGTETGGICRALGVEEDPATDEAASVAQCDKESDATDSLLGTSKVVETPRVAGRDL